MYNLSCNEGESKYLDDLNDYATTERVRMVMFQMLARNQLTQAELMILALRGVMELDDFACTGVSHDPFIRLRAATHGGKVWALIRSDFDEQRESAA